MSNLRKAVDQYGNTFMVDMGTRNQSFLQTHQELKYLGIKNNAFMLKLIDPSLAGVDPHDPNIDNATADRVQLECARNFWYYVREVARIPIQNSAPVPLYLHRASCAQFWLFLQHIDNTLNIPRRCYKTSNTLAGPYCWTYNFGLRNGNMQCFNYENSQAQKNLDTMKGMLDALPKYMRYPAIVVEDNTKQKKKKLSIKKKTDNVRSIRHPVTNNVITTRGKAMNVDSALKFGRGDAINMPYFDEAEWINFLPDILAASGPSYQEALNMAMKTGAAACRLFTTTPGYKNIPQHRNNFEKFIAIQPVWSEKLYDMTYDEIQEYMLNNGNGFTKILYIEYDYLKCRRDDKWLEDMLVSLQGNRLKFRTEVLLQRLSADENGPFDPYDVDYLIQNKKEPITQILLNGSYRFDVYQHLDIDVGQYLDPQLPYFIGIDPATGVGGDSTAFVGINPYNLKPAFEFGSAYISEPKVIALIVTLVRMLPRSIVFIETRSSGSAIIAGIRESYPDVAARLYKSEYDPSKIYIKEQAQPYVNETDRRNAIEKKLYGISTGQTSRAQIQDLWVEYVNTYKSVIYSGHVVSELSTMTKTAAGKIEASSGAHDDFSMAWGFCLWGYHHGQKLERYGFVKPEHHPLEKDKMPPRSTVKEIPKAALADPNARIINQANVDVFRDSATFARFLSGTKPDGLHRRSFEFTPENGVVQSDPNAEPGWIDFVDAAPGVTQMHVPIDDFDLF